MCDSIIVYIEITGINNITHTHTHTHTHINVFQEERYIHDLPSVMSVYVDLTFVPLCSRCTNSRKGFTYFRRIFFGCTQETEYIAYSLTNWLQKGYDDDGSW